MLSFEHYALPVNAAAFAGAALVVWQAGTGLSTYADEIASRTGVGRAVIGALLLGGITSLPEVATAVAASLIGNAPLAVNNLFGGVAMQVTILAGVDLVIPGRPLAGLIRQPAVLLQAVLLMAVLAVAAAGISAGDVPVLGVGFWTIAVLGAALLSFVLIHRFASEAAWRPADSGADPVPDRPVEGRRVGSSAARLGVSTVAAAAVILAAGFVLARSGDALAVQSGLGASFVGVLFLAVATSLPEISTTLAAVRLGAYTMAYSNIFGANILDLSILGLVDAVYTGGPVLNEVGRFSAVAALLGVALTAVCLAGLLLRPMRVVLGAGVDSLLMLALYAAGMALLYAIRT